jgi:hypothetical protein
MAEKKDTTPEDPQAARQREYAKQFKAAQKEKEERDAAAEAGPKSVAERIHEVKDK